MSTASVIILSAFAVLGMYYFIHLIMEIVFTSNMEDIVTVVPVSSNGAPLDELLRTINGCSAIGATVVVDLSGNITDAEKYINSGLCCCIAKPEELGDVLRKIME